MGPIQQVSYLITKLTNDEDLQQDLWVCYLSGNHIDSLENHLSSIKAEYSTDLELQRAIWQLINNPINSNLALFIEDNFTDFERSIICYLMLGADAKKISEVKGICEVRIRQSIASIRYNTVWEVMYGTKEESNR